MINTLKQIKYAHKCIKYTNMRIFMHRVIKNDSFCDNEGACFADVALLFQQKQCRNAGFLKNKGPDVDKLAAGW